MDLWRSVLERKGGAHLAPGGPRASLASRAAPQPKKGTMKTTKSHHLLATLAVLAWAGLVAMADPLALVNVGHVNDGGPLEGIVVVGHYAYLANGMDHLRAYDVSDPANAVSVGHVVTYGYSSGVAVAGNTLFLADQGAGLGVYDISNPYNIVNLGYYYDGYSAMRVTVAGQYAYLANDGDGLRIYDISDPLNLVNVGHVGDGSFGVYGVAVAGQYAYLANYLDGLRIYDVSNPGNLVNVAHVHDGGAGGSARNVVVAGRYAYVANAYDGLRIYDVSNPYNVVNVGHRFDGGIGIDAVAFDVAVAGRFCYVANWQDGLRIYDISDPGNILCVAHSQDSVKAQSVAVAGSYVYLGDQDGGLRIYFFEPLAFSGFLPPIGGADATGGSFASPVRTFKMGSTIPVKFTVSFNGLPVVTGIHRLHVIKYSNATPLGSSIDAAPQVVATTGNQFRLADGQWVFDLDTRMTGMSIGIWQLVATLSDASQHSTFIQLK
jgi:hypothetical protein